MQTLTINASDKTVVANGMIAIRELAQVFLVGIGSSDPRNLVLNVMNGDEQITSCSNFSTSGSNIVGVLDLSVVNALALFNPTDMPLALKEVYFTLWDSNLNSLLLDDYLTVQNNVFVSP